jgi:hypothetical protein
MIAMNVRRSLAWAAVTAAVAGVVVAIVAGPIVRGGEFHRYADDRGWLGIPNAGDVLSNLAFVVVAAWSALQLRLRGARIAPRLAWAACAGVAAIGVGSAVYHAAPGDATLVFDWGPIVVTLALITSAVIVDRIGARAGAFAAVVAPLAAAGAVAWWWASGGTAGGDMAPYVAIQAVGIALPPILAIATPGAIELRDLLCAVAGFALARLLASYDADALDAIGISGHSLKHVAAAIAAGFALRALTAPPAPTPGAR